MRFISLFASCLEQFLRLEELTMPVHLKDCCDPNNFR
jgi:hypothetical protein